MQVFCCLFLNNNGIGLLAQKKSETVTNYNQ